MLAEALVRGLAAGRADIVAAVGAEQDVDEGAHGAARGS
jgi:hypothetical protein